MAGGQPARLWLVDSQPGYGWWTASQAVAGGQPARLWPVDSQPGCGWWTASQAVVAGEARQVGAENWTTERWGALGGAGARWEALGGAGARWEVLGRAAPCVPSPLGLSSPNIDAAQQRTSSSTRRLPPGTGGSADFLTKELHVFTTELHVLTTGLHVFTTELIMFWGVGIIMP